MTVLVAIPVFRVSCRVGIDKGRAWSVIDELILWALSREAKAIGVLAQEMRLQPQIIVASIARLMRFRLIEVITVQGGAAFRASEFGISLVTGGKQLPFFPTRQSRPASFVIEWVSGEFFPTRDIHLMSPYKLDIERDNGADIRTLVVEGGGPSVSHEANLRRLADIVARGIDEEVATIDGRTASLHDDEFMIIRVIDGVIRGLPEKAGENLRNAIQRATNLEPGIGEISIGYSGPREELDAEPILRPCVFDLADLVIGGTEQRESFLQLLWFAHRRAIIHSTFLDSVRFAALLEPIRAACLRGVTFDLLWGDEEGDEPDNKNAKAAIEIARLVREDRVLNGRFRVHLGTTKSHAKLMMVDTEQGWVASIGSCNWLSSPFNSVELSVVLRDPAVVADVAVALQRLVGRRGLSDNIATEMAMAARDLRGANSAYGSASVGIITGEMHDHILRSASGAANRLFCIGSNRLGSTARPGALMQSEAAAGRTGVTATILYTQPAGPLKNRHARALAAEAKSNGVRLIRTRKTTLHGKFVAWDDDDVVITSLNWASASADPDFPWGDIGVHIHMATAANVVVDRLRKIFPELAEPSEGSEGLAGET